MKLAAQLFTVRKFTQTDADCYETLKKLKAIGYNAVQVSACGPFRAEWLAEVLKELDMEVCVTHTPIDRILNETETVIAEHKTFGCDTIGIGSLPLKEYDRVSVLEFFEKLAPALDKIHEAGLSFVFHNHWMEFVPNGEDGKNTFDLYCERFPADRAGILMDFYWMVYSCQKPLESIDKYADRLGIVHFKDMTMNEKGERIFTEVYEGCIDYTAIYNKLVEANCKWVAVEEDVIPKDGDPFEALAKSLANIKAHGLAFENI